MGTISDRYFSLSHQIDTAQKQGNYRLVASLSRQTFPLLPMFVAEWKREYGGWDDLSSRAVHPGGTILAVLGDREGIEELRNAVSSVADLRSWQPVVDQVRRDADLVERITAAIRSKDRLVQRELKDLLGEVDGRRIAILTGWLEKAEIIRRKGTGGGAELSMA